MRRIWLLVTAAALMAATGCGDRNDAATSRSEAADMVDPDAIGTAELQTAVSDDRVRKFYESRNWKPAWARETVGSLVDALRGAARHGLDPMDYVVPVDRADGPAAREAALTKAALDLADALGDGKIDPNGVFEIYTLPQPRLNLAAGLNRAVEENVVGAWLDRLAPQDAEYRALSEAYLHYTSQAARGAGRAIATGEAIRPGDTDPRVPQIVEVLRSNGYLPQESQQEDRPEGDQANRYTPAIAEAVKRMQQDYGLDDDGVVGSGTLEVLNTGPEARARTLAVNLERLRWLRRNPPETRIDVNIAAATLDYYRDGQHRDHRRVVVGQPGWETPQLGSPLFRLVANPTWTVPKSIEEEEIAPLGAGYLRRNNMVRRDGWIVQLPGPTNALGLVKFDMRNDHAIYLHDTPAKPLFERNQRHFSHGCVRVHNAEQFARLLAQDSGVLAEYDRASATGEETFVKLDREIPVRLIYRTAFADRSGKVLFRTDPYGWDDRVAQALGYEPGQARKLQTHIRDVGP